MYIPAAPADAELPVVLFLHDYAETIDETNHWIVDVLNAIEPVVVFFPQRTEDEGDYAWGEASANERTLGMTAALEQLYQVQTTYNTSSQRIYVYGEGMGADGIYKLLLEFPGIIAGAVAVAGNTNAAQLKSSNEPNLMTWLLGNTL